LISALGNPLISSSIHSEDEIQEYLTEPYEIYEKWQDKINLIVDGGAGKNTGTTVIEASTGEISIIREGLGIEKV
jgi:tRNA A37 threonylcarbamoyladenosine synthetase subunit TsaC/SUA5/YrdC